MNVIYTHLVKVHSLLCPQGYFLRDRTAVVLQEWPTRQFPLEVQIWDQQKLQHLQCCWKLELKGQGLCPLSQHSWDWQMIILPWNKSWLLSKKCSFTLLTKGQIGCIQSMALTCLTTYMKKKRLIPTSPGQEYTDRYSQEHTFTKELANTKSMYWLTPQLTITGAHALPTQQKAESTDLTCNSVSAFY